MTASKQIKAEIPRVKDPWQVKEFKARSKSIAAWYL
jgi:hypothetical protein